MEGSLVENTWIIEYTIFAGNGRAISMASAGCSHAWPHAVRNRDIASLLRRPLGRFRDFTDQLWWHVMIVAHLCSISSDIFPASRLGVAFFSCAKAKLHHLSLLCRSDSRHLELEFIHSWNLFYVNDSQGKSPILLPWWRWFSLWQLVSYALLSSQCLGQNPSFASLLDVSFGKLRSCMKHALPLA